MSELFYDVLILGGGTSGCACAYNCAKLGLKTLLIEKNNYLGGLMTGGLVVPVMKSSIEELNCEYYKKLIELSKDYNSQITYFDGNDGWLNPEMLKIILVDLLTSKDLHNNLEILFETDIDHVNLSSAKIESVILNSKMLSLPIKSNHYVDATGYGKLLKLSGCKFLDDCDIKQQNSLRFVLGNVDFEKFAVFIKSVDSDENITNTYRFDSNGTSQIHFTTASTWDNNKVWALDEYLKKGVNEGILKDTDRAYFQLFSIAQSQSQVAFNCPRINNFPNNPFKYSNELIEGYRAIFRLYKFVKKYFPGFENSEIVNIADMTGVREEGRLNSKYIYKDEDLISSKSFDNAALSANYSIDIHSDKKDCSILQKTAAYELPIESLISSEITNLFAIGKLVGAQFRAHSALRVQKSCMSMGEAVAKYIAKIS